VANPKTIVINDYGDAKLIQRTRSSSKEVYSVQISSERIAVLVDEMELARPVAEAIAQAIREQTKAITAQVSKATIGFRKVAGKAFASGQSWALKRYSGGKTGATPPGQGTAFGNDSGRLANGIFANPDPSTGSFQVKAPANRLQRESFGNDGAFDRFVARWIELVPALTRPLDDLGVRRVLSNVTEKMHRKLAMQAAEKQAEVLVSALEWGARLLG
jgi:predicted nucleic acid-binding protein